MFIDAKKIATAAIAIDTKDKYRRHLQGVCFDFDSENNILTMVGTDAQIMIITKTQITKSDDIELCKKHFNLKGYIIPDELLKIKGEIEITEKDGELRAGVYILQPVDGQYPNYRVVVPRGELEPVAGYRSFAVKLLQKANKAFGLKDPVMITDTPPMAAPGADFKSPVVWDSIDDKFNGCKIVLMPRRTQQDKGE